MSANSPASDQLNLVEIASALLFLADKAALDASNALSDLFQDGQGRVAAVAIGLAFIIANDTQEAWC